MGHRYEWRGNSLSTVFPVSGNPPIFYDSAENPPLGNHSFIQHVGEVFFTHVLLAIPYLTAGLAASPTLIPLLLEAPNSKGIGP